MEQFSRGALAMAALVCGLFFLRFLRTSGDRLFAFFTAAFWTLALHWVLLAWVAPSAESRHELYLLRLVAFVTLIVGILDKNARAARSHAPAQR